MAKKLKDEDLVLNIIINGNKSKKEMNELERAITDTNREINTLKKVQRDLIAQGKKESDAYRATVVAIEKKNKAVAQAEARLTQLRSEIKLTEMSMSDLRKEQRRLKALMDTAIPKSDNYEMYKKQLEEVRGRIDELTDSAEDSGFSLREMAGQFNHYIGVITAGIVTLVGVVSGLQTITTTFAEFDDKVADVQKTTGLAKDEVIELNEELKNINTRTTQEDLLGLSRVAGKLGINAKEDILGFVKATDQIGVALAEDLGGDVEEAINQVGKLVDIFQLKEEFGIEKSLLKVGSTINELGASSTANEGYLVNFTNRMAGVAPLAGVTIQQVLGLGATLDQFGQTAEVSSTALSQLFIKMSSDASKYSKYARMSVGDFKAALEKDFMGTFMKVLEGVKSNAGGINDLADSLGDLGLDGGRVVGVLGTLANNTYVLKQQLDLANQSFADGTSLTNEFNIKNETAAAKLEKARKLVYNMTVELGEKLYPVMTLTANGFTKMVKILSVLIDFVIKHRVAISTIVAALVGYNAVVFITNALTAESVIRRKAEIALAKLKVFWDNAQAASMHLLGAAYFLLRGNIAGARAQMVLFNAVTAANPIAIVVAVLAAAVVGIAMYTRSLTAAEKAQRLLNDIQIEANKTTAETKNNVAALQRILEDEVATRGEKLNAVKQLRELMPEHLKAYTDEQILAGQATKAISLYVQELERKARVEATSRKLAELDAQRDEIAKKKNEGWGGASFGDKLKASVNGSRGFLSGVDGYIDLLAERDKEVETAQELLRKKMDRDIRGNYDLSTVEGMQQQADAMQKALAKLKKGSKEYKEALADIQSLNYSIAYKKANPDGVEKLDLGESEKDRKARLKAEREAATATNKQRIADLAAEKFAYQERLKEAGLFGLQKTAMTSEQLEQLALLEQEHQDKVNSINEKGNKKAIEKTSQALAEMRKRQESEKLYREKLINPENELIEQENESHNQRLEKAGLFGKQREQLTENQLKALETLESIHRAKLNKVDAQLISQNLDEKQKAFDTELASLKYKHFKELSEIKSYSDAKKILANHLDSNELAGIRNLADARKALKRVHLKAENDLAIEFGEDLMKQLKNAIDTGVLDVDGLKLADKVLSKEEYEALKDKFLKLSEMMGALKNPEGEKEEKSEYKIFDSSAGGDILGFTAEDWDQLFTNLSNGKFGIQEMALAVQALSSAWGMYDKFATASEQKKVKQYEADSAKQKELLQSQLNSGQLSQKKYNEQVAKLDADLDKKKQDIEKDQARRQKVMAVMNIISSTAQAIMSIWAQVPKFDFGISAGILTGIVGGIGAAQLALAMSAPGLEEGGYVTRAQDGKKFKAKHQGKKRGYIDETSVLVSENGSEFVASADAVKNPHIKQVLDMIDSAQRNGNVSTLTLEKMMFSSSASNKMMGKQNGGYVSNSSEPAPTNDAGYIKLMADYVAVSKKLMERLDQPITAEVALLGKNGFIEKKQEYDTIINESGL